MKALPSLTIMIITYNRRAELKQTSQALYNYLYYDAPIKYLIADDCTGGTYREDVLSDAGSARMGEETSYVSTPENRGWAGNFNNAYQHVKDDVVLLVEDDRVLTRELDISPYVALLMEHSGVGLVRLDGIAGHRTVLHTAETDIRDYMPHYRQGMGALGKLNYFLIDAKSPDLYLYSNQPHLIHRRFHEWYGLYPEGMKLGQTEEAFAHIVKDKMVLPDAPALTVTLDATGWWDHTGVSFQHSEFDKEHAVK